MGFVFAGTSSRYAAKPSAIPPSSRSRRICCVMAMMSASNMVLMHLANQLTGRIGPNWYILHQRPYSFQAGIKKGWFLPFPCFVRQWVDGESSMALEKKFRRQETGDRRQETGDKNILLNKFSAVVRIRQ